MYLKYSELRYLVTLEYSITRKRVKKLTFGLLWSRIIETTVYPSAATLSFKQFSTDSLRVMFLISIFISYKL